MTTTNNDLVDVYQLATALDLPTAWLTAEAAAERIPSVRIKSRGRRSVLFDVDAVRVAIQDRARHHGRSDDVLLTIAETAERLHVPPCWLQRMVDEKRLPRHAQTTVARGRRDVVFHLRSARRRILDAFGDFPPTEADLTGEMIRDA